MLTRRLGSVARFSLFLATATVMLWMTVTATASTEVRLKSGLTWRGELNDRVEVSFMENGHDQKLEGTVVRADSSVFVLDTVILGHPAKKTLFVADIKSIKGLAAAPANTVAANAVTPNSATAAPATTATAPATPDLKAKYQLPSTYKGVIVLPLEGHVGSGITAAQIDEIGKEADKIGPGQIILFVMDSGGGSVIEAGKIHIAMRELKKRHRIIAWIKEAISAASLTAYHCDEIYFMSIGSMGSMTGFNGATMISLSGVPLQALLDLAAEIAAESGRDPHMAQAMIRKELECSYDIPPGGGPKDAVFRPDARGQHVLDTKETCLCFNASNALACGFSDGTADTEEQLAKLLNLPEWKEATDVGRKMHSDKQRLLKRASDELPKLMQRYGYKGTSSGDPIVILGSRIRVIEELISWRDRCTECCDENNVPPKDFLERRLKDLKEDLAALRKQQKKNG